VAPDGARQAGVRDPEQWRAAARKKMGSWWNDLTGWLADRAGPRGAPPPLGSATYTALCDAPGTYVLER
jgi:polyhydroxyalkanoate synthase